MSDSLRNTTNIYTIIFRLFIICLCLVWFIFCLTSHSTILPLIYDSTLMCRRTEEVGTTVGLPCHRHFVGFFNVPVKAPTRGQHFHGYSEKLRVLKLYFVKHYCFFCAREPFTCPSGGVLHLQMDNNSEK